MSFVVKRRDLSDPAELQALIVEHADDLERGLTILDSRLLLGQATIDVVGLDADRSLVLIAVGLVADEEMFLKAVEAYSWCLEYPESIRRLYPGARISTAQPPRVMFVVERMPDAFHRKIKQLGIPEVDCVEFRHLDVDGTPAVYFDSLAKLRRDMAATAPTAEHASPPTAPGTNGRPTSLKLQKLLGADRPAAGREPAPVVRMVQRATPRPEPKPLVGAPKTDRLPKRNVDQPVSPIVCVTEAPHLPEPSAPAVPAQPSVETVATAVVSEALAAEPDLLAEGLEAAETLVEPFAIADHAAQNGHVGALTTTVAEAPCVTLEPARLALEPEPEPAVIPELTLAAPEPPHVVAEPTLVIEESERAIQTPSLEVESALPEPEPILEVEPGDIVQDVMTAELMPSPAPAAAEAATSDDAPVVVASLPELEPMTATVSAPELEAVAPLQIVDDVPEPIESDPEPVVAAPIVAEAEPVVPTLSLETITPPTPPAPPAPAPSVFSRRPPEAVSARTEPKVSFAGVAKNLLAQPNRTAEPEPPVSVPRASVEEITRAAIDDLVGATEKRTTDERAATAAKPSGPFAKAPTQKRPRTIAPPPSEGQPIAGAPKLGAAVNRLGGAPAPAAATELAPATAPDGETTQQIPQPFEGLQFPNDGVLTRQWMEFLNQMAAGK